MKSKSSIWLYTAIGTALGAGIGMTVGKTFCRTDSLKRQAGKALHAAGSFIEHLK